MNRDISVIILAGGAGTRLGGQDKGLLELNAKPMVKHLIDTFSPHCAHLIISANRNIKQYQQYGYPVIADHAPCYQGPLAGIAACLDVTPTPYALLVACDMPLLPANIIDRLLAALQAQQSTIAIAHDGLQQQPLCMIIKTELKDALHQAIQRQELKVLRWLNSQNIATVDCADIKAAFTNLNSLQDIEHLPSI